MIYKNGIITGNEFNESFQNLSMVGDVTVNNGVASGFTASKYLKTPRLNIDPTKNWLIKMKMTTGSVSSNQNFFSGLDADIKGIVFGIYSQKFTIYASSDGTNWDIMNGSKATTACAANTTYWLKLSFDKTKYVIEVSTNGTNFTTWLSVSSTKSVYDMSSFFIGISRVLNIPFAGSIDLKELVVESDGNIIYSPALKTVISPYQTTANNFYEI